MGKKDKRLPINSVGKLIKEAREKQNLSIEELTWKLNKPKITKKLISDWEKGNEFPDLDNIYLLAEHLNLNPNELLNKRLTIQDESIHEINPAKRRVGGKAFEVLFVIVRQAVKWIAGICIIVVAANYKNFENKMNDPNDPEQMKFIESTIDNAVDDFTVNEIKETYFESVDKYVGNTASENTVTNSTNK